MRLESQLAQSSRPTVAQLTRPREERIDVKPPLNSFYRLRVWTGLIREGENMQIYNAGVGRSRWTIARGGASLFFLLLWTLVTGSAAAAQQRVNGIVTDKSSGQPVSSASVKLEGDALSTERATTTDVEGRFSLSVLSPGS